MAYTYKYYPPSLGTINKNPKDAYIELFEENLRDQFYNSSDVFTIMEETSFGSGQYQNVDVRVNKVIDTSTGDRVGDDFRKILFSDLNHTTDLGWMYQFDSNHWIVTNIDKVKSLTTSAVVRRCNNVLRWFDSDGGYYEVPCAIGYLIKENRDFLTSGSNIVNPSGMIECYVQANENTNKIRPNQRFLFGNSSNWSAWRVEGGGINNFLNRVGSDNSTNRIIILSMSVDYINPEEDDVVNGVANAHTNQYSIFIDKSSITGAIGGSISLVANVYLDTNIVVRDIVWSSSNSGVCTVSSGGAVTFVSDGSAIITAAMKDNSSVSDSCSVVVSETPATVYQIVYSPTQNIVLEDENVTWEFTLYKDGVAQADSFVFTLSPNTVPSSNYQYIVIDGNSFAVQNFERYLNDVITVTATSGSNSVSLDISLRGKW